MMPPIASTRTRNSFLAALGLLLAALLVLFGGLLGPGQVMFANDGTLGGSMSQADVILSTFSGIWRPLNWIGGQDLSAPPNLTMGLFLALGPVVFAKLYAAFSLLFLGLAAWFFCRCARFHSPVGVLVAVAAALNTNPVTYAAWGLAPKALALGFALIALGLLRLAMSATGWRALLLTVLAGFSVGLVVMEGADMGAILSLYVAAFAAWQAWIAPGPRAQQLLRGGLRLAVVAVCAAWIAAHALSSLIGTQIKGVSGMQQNQESHEQRWEFATGWSYPKIETLRLAVPGLFGYRMDTEGGGAYWGGVGQDGTPQTRFSGSGEYAGVLVLLVAAFGIQASLRGRQSPFDAAERKMVWFWAVVAVVSLLLAWGRFAPFYQFVFALPYFSTIRIPMKFLHGMHLALWILFAYGLEALARGYLATDRPRRTSFGAHWRAWRAAAPLADRRWVFGSLAVLGVAVLAAVIYASSASTLTQYLATIPFGESPPATAAFSIREVCVAVAYLAVSCAAVGLIVTGWWSGGQAKVAWCALGLILVTDLVRANTPWVKHYDYVQRYQSNVVIDLLKERPWEHRVTAYLNPRRSGLLVPDQTWAYLQKEWLEHQFQYFRIQSLDIDQMPRVPEMEKAYFTALTPPILELAGQLAALGPQLDRMPAEQAARLKPLIPAAATNLFYATRLWQLTNTRYVLGMRDGIEVFNQLFDPTLRRFRVKLPFALTVKPGVTPPGNTTPIADAVQALTAVASDQGPFAVLEFSGALPRVQLFRDWRTSPDDGATLMELRSPAFDPAKTVLLAETPALTASASTGPQGEATISSYLPKRVAVKTKSDAASVLLLNDRWHPDWKVTVDGQPEPLLRANFIMRGVAVPAGEHTVEFRFEPSAAMLWVSLSALVVALATCLGLVLAGRGEKSDSVAPAAQPKQR